MTEEEKIYHDVAQQQEQAEKSQMFGKPCYKIGGKAFVAFFQNEMVFKLNAHAHQDALSLDGAQLFDPSGKGRAMKEWVQVPGKHIALWQQFAKSAYEFVLQQAK